MLSHLPRSKPKTGKKTWWRRTLFSDTLPTSMTGNDLAKSKAGFPLCDNMLVVNSLLRLLQSQIVQ
jgi:hypothetical protein